MKFNQTRLCDR